MPTTSRNTSRRPVGRPSSITADDVLDAATKIVTQEGLDALTVRRLAADLGVSVYTAHSHMGSKDALLDQVVSRLVLDNAEPHDLTGLDWLEVLRLSAVELRRVMLTHPTVIEVMTRRVIAPEPGIAALEAFLTLAEGAGVTPAAARAGYDIVHAFVLGAASLDSARDPELELLTHTANAAAYQDRLPRAAAMMRERATKSRDARFAEQLDALLAALAISSTR